MANDDRSEPSPPNAEQAAIDPAGPPVPVAKSDPVLDLLAGVGMILVLGGGVLLPALLDIGTCHGATRSAKLEWEQRNAEIERVIAAEATPRPEKPL